MSFQGFGITRTQFGYLMEKGKLARGTSFALDTLYIGSAQIRVINLVLFLDHRSLVQGSRLLR